MLGGAGFFGVGRNRFASPLRDSGVNLAPIPAGRKNRRVEVLSALFSIRRERERAGVPLRAKLLHLRFRVRRR